MSLDQVLSTLTSSQYFIVQYNEVIERSGAKQLQHHSGANKLEHYTNPEIDWNYLLKIANLLAFSPKFEYREKALRIATSNLLFTNKNDGFQNSSVSLLRQLSNFRTIELAKKKGILEENSGSEVSTVSEVLAEKRTEIFSKIFVGENQSFIGNNFQNEFWDSFHSNRIVSES